MKTSSQNNPNSNRKQVRWRLSEPIHAELAYHFRRGGHRSWDEFFTALLARWNNQPRPVPMPAPEKMFQTLQADFNHSRILMEDQIESFHEFETHQNELISLIQRLNGMLELVLTPAEEPPARPLSPMQEILQQVRPRRAR